MSTTDGTDMELEAALRRGATGATGAAASLRAEAEAAAGRFAQAAERAELLDVAYGTVDSPFGPLLAAGSPRGLLRLAFPEEDPEAALETLARRVSPRVLRAPGRIDPLRRELEGYFAGRLRRFATPVDWALVGPFGRRVLAAASGIPYGGVLTYTEVAAQAGSPRGSRAAGNALGSNPVPIVVPCHRVLRSGGGLGGYAGGLERKRWLLELEGALAPADGPPAPGLSR